MKFLCVSCDEAMSLNETKGPFDGAMTVVFGCPACGREVAMLTNPMETQMVRSLGVKIGGRKEPAAPMETIRTTLAQPREGAFADEVPEAAEPTSDTASKCPFTHEVAKTFQPTAAPSWTPSSEASLARIPSYARPMVRQGIEQFARDQGLAEIDDAVMDEMRGQFGM